MPLHAATLLWRPEAEQGNVTPTAKLERGRLNVREGGYKRERGRLSVSEGVFRG